MKMSDFRQCGREFLLEFIELYRTLPSLWKIKSHEYSDRIIKNKAYETLLTKLKEVDPKCSIVTVKKKIDSLRGSFRKELKKINSSSKSGAATDDIYKPHLWYFDHLLFLSDQETPRSGRDNVGEDEDENEEVENSDRVSTYKETT